MAMNMTPSRPYLIRAIHEWIVDNDLTPYILVNANFSGAIIPEEFVESGKIILNVSYKAVRDLQMDNDWIQFNARFSGRAMNVSIPTAAVLAIYAKENGQGMVLEEEKGGTPPPAGPSKEKSGKPHLKLVK
ncbi:MAG: ClpXP protease specificity-enhancing factor [Gammaproteobacteria bacterium]